MPVKPSKCGYGPLVVCGGVGSTGKYPVYPPLRTFNIVLSLIVQVTCPFQFHSGDGSSAVTSVVGRLTLAPRPATSYLSHSTNPSTRTLGIAAHVTFVIVRGSFCVVKFPVKPAGRVASS